MLYGNLIFIKKTGGDGSKYPVTEREIKIGRSENCLIRIYNPHVALEHCQLIIEDNGQATLRNLSNQSILNGKPLSNGDVTLCHGDIFKLGERLARWEYLPTSKFYKQLLSPTGRLVAVVMPQQRSSGDHAAPGTSSSEISVLKNTPLGKRRFSERVTSENSSSVKIRKSNASELIHKGKQDLQKFLTGHHSLRSTEWVLRGEKVKERKSISGIVGSKTPKGKTGKKCRKSTLPSWKVNIVSPSGRKSSGNKNSLPKPNQKSTKSPKNTVQILLRDMEESKPEKLLVSDSDTDVKGPQKIILKSESLNDSVKSVLKKSVMTEKELPLNFSKRSTKSTCSLSQSLENAALKSPSKFVSSTPLKVSSTSNQNSSLKFGRLVHSESKLISKKHPVLFKGKKKKNFILNKMDFTPRQSSRKRSIKEKKTKTPQIEMSDVSSEVVLTPVKNSEVNSEKKNEILRKSLKNTLIKNSKTSKETPRKSLLNKTLKSPDMKTPRKSVIIETPRSLTRKQSKTSRMSISENVALDTRSQTLPLIGESEAPNPKKSKPIYRKSTTAESPVSRETAIKLIKNPGRNELPLSNQEIQNETVSSGSSSPVNKNFHFSSANSTQTLTSTRNSNCLIITSRTMSSLKAGTPFPRGGQRELSPSSSAERAAKKLKTSCPKKPDKNKKAALLVLGKANRKQHVSQNMKVLLRQKILKKAIKQSTVVSAFDDKVGIKAANKLKKGPGKNTSKPKCKKFKKKNKSSENSSPKYMKMLGETNVKSSTEEKTQEETSKSKKIVTTKVLQTSPCLSTDGVVQSVSKQIKQSEFSSSDNSKNFMEKTNSPLSIFEKSAENYFFSSNRRCSKRLSYKNDTGRPDFVELSPTALGLIPKNIEIFKTPKDNKRRSSSLVTPKNIHTTGIIKSASTSKIGNRKNVRFSSKDVSINSGFCSPNMSERIDFNFSHFETPNITVDVFVSPLMDQNAVLKHGLNESKVTPEVKELSNNSIKSRKSNLVPKTQSPSSKKKLHETFSNPSEFSQIPSSSLSKSLSSRKDKKQLKFFDENKDQISNLSDLIGSRQFFSTPKLQKSPKNDLSDVRGVKKLMLTPKLQKSPKNDLSDVRGVKKLMLTPKLQKSPKNELTDVRGVKKLMRTPKLQKSPKNELTDVRGIKKLMRTPKLQKSPKNDLTDVRGVKKLMRTPKLQKSPKNDLTDVRGVKKLMRTPKLQKSPKNDLTDMRGVKKLMRTPKLQKSPKNDLTDMRGVKKLMRTPKLQKSPKNDLSDVKGVKELLGSPELQKCSKNDLTDITGVEKLFTKSLSQKSSRGSLLEVSEIEEPFESSVVQQHSKNSVEGGNILSSQTEENVNTSLANEEMEQLLISKSSERVSKSKKAFTRNSHIKDFRAIRGRKAIHLRSKSPKNDLSDVTGVRELFARHKPISDYNINLTGVADLFEFTKIEVAREQKLIKKKKKEIPESVQKESKTRTLRPKKILKNEVETKSSTRLRLRKAVKEEIEKKSTRSKKLEAIKNFQEEKPIKKKTEEKLKASQVKKALAAVKKSQKVAEKETKTGGKKSLARRKVECSEEDQSGVRNSRKRKILLEDVGISPPKLRRKVPASEKMTSNETIETCKKIRTRTGRFARKETSLESVKKVLPVRVNKSEAATIISEVQLKGAIKTAAKQIRKVQNKRSHVKSKKNILNNEKKETLRKTRSSKATPTARKISSTQSKSTEKKSVRSTARKEKSSPVIKRSSRRK